MRRAFTSSILPLKKWRSPITHTMDQPVALSVVVEVEPSNACTETGTFSGAGPGQVQFDPVTVTYKPGRNSPIRLQSTGKLPKAVQLLRFSATWTTVAPSGSFSSQTSNYAC